MVACHGRSLLSSESDCCRHSGWAYPRRRLGQAADSESTGNLNIIMMIWAASVGLTSISSGPGTRKTVTQSREKSIQVQVSLSSSCLSRSRFRARACCAMETVTQVASESHCHCGMPVSESWPITAWLVAPLA